MRHHELHMRIDGYSTATGGPEACLRAIAHIDYCRRGAAGIEPEVVGKIHPQMTPVDFVKSTIALQADKPSTRVLEKIQMDLPNEYTEKQCREVLRRFLVSEIGDSEAVALAWIHWKPGNHHVHVNFLDGLESKKSAKARAAKRAATSDGKKTRVRRRHHLRYGDLYRREPGTLGPTDKGELTKAYLRRAWAETVNAHSKDLGIALHFEHRSFATRGILFEPTKHEGAATRALKEKFEAAERREMMTGDAVPLHGAVVAASEDSLVDENGRILKEREKIQSELAAVERETCDTLQSPDRQIPLAANSTKKKKKAKRNKVAKLQAGVRVQRWLTIGANRYAVVAIRKLVRTWRQGIRDGLALWPKIRSWIKDRPSPAPVSATALPNAKARSRQDRALEKYIAAFGGSDEKLLQALVGFEAAIRSSAAGISDADRERRMRKELGRARPDLLTMHDKIVHDRFFKKPAGARRSSRNPSPNISRKSDPWRRPTPPRTDRDARRSSR